LEHLVAGERRYALPRAEDALAERVPGPVERRRQVEDVEVRPVLVHRALLEDDLLLAVEVLLPEARPHQPGEDARGLRQALAPRRTAGDGPLGRGAGVVLGAALVDAGVEVASRVGLVAPEQQVLEGVRAAGGLGRLVARAGVDEEPGRHAGGAVVVL